MKNLDKSLLISCGATILVIVIIIINLVTCWLQQGTFIILSFTLLAVIWYTYFTYQLAVKKEQPVVVASIHYIPEQRDVRVHVANRSNRYAETRVWIEVRVYGQNTALGPDYNGQTTWHLTPQFEIEGHFPLDKPLQQLGKDFSTMRREANEENLTRQFQLSLRVEWKDEEGKIGKYPEHLWYFDFKANNFVYQVGGFRS